MKRVYSGEGVKTVNAIEVTIKFSKEIAYWGDTYYYENPKFWEFWDKVNSDKKYRNDKNKRDNLWYVMYCNRYCQELAEEGKLRGSVLRMLTMTQDTMKAIAISPTMNTILIHKPSEWQTTHILGLNDLAILCRDCAKYCGGTVEITYSARQRYFVWDEVETKTLTLGKGIGNKKVNEPKAKKKCVEGKYCSRTKKKERLI